MGCSKDVSKYIQSRSAGSVVDPSRFKIKITVSTSGHFSSCSGGSRRILHTCKLPKLSCGRDFDAFTEGSIALGLIFGSQMPES